MSNIMSDSWAKQLRGYYIPNLKVACFVCYLKIINPFFLKNNVCILNISKLSKELKNGIEILVGHQAAFKLWIKTVKMLFWLVTQESLRFIYYFKYFSDRCW